MSSMTNFGRKTWNREEYAQLAQEEETLTHEEQLKTSLSYDKLQRLKDKYTDHNKLLRESTGNLNKKVLDTGITSYKKGKQFGFYCELCDLTYKDTYQYIDHLNHKSHQLKFKSIFGEDLIVDKRDNDDVPLTEFTNEYRTLVSRFVKQHESKSRRIIPSTKTSKKSKNTKAHPTDALRYITQESMGFSSFHSTKK